MQPSISISVGITSSRNCAMPASMDVGAAVIVVERAYTIHPLTLRAAPRRRRRFETHTAPLLPTWQCPTQAAGD
ncbi:hypothetical protein GCM10009742_40500 [Kribbella karoonensis]|uniref:Uncharacterized protein n=1 Tax=Kribbella karoonensis TaxID=324851 RepID=A0ABN2DY81_9ACTN